MGWIRVGDLVLHDRVRMVYLDIYALADLPFLDL